MVAILATEIKEGYVRVTDVLAHVNRFDAVVGPLRAYIDRLGNEKMNTSPSAVQYDLSHILAPYYRMETKGKIGTWVHQMIDQECEHFPLMEEVRAEQYLESYRRWREKTGLEVLKKEQRFYCDKLRLTGCVDAIARFPGSEELVIVDYKTSAQANDKIWRLQALAYWYLASQNQDLKCGPHVLFVQLSDNGALPKVHTYEWDEKLFRSVFIGALNCAHYAKV